MIYPLRDSRLGNVEHRSDTFSLVWMDVVEDVEKHGKTMDSVSLDEVSEFQHVVGLLAGLDEGQVTLLSYICQPNVLY